MSIKSWAKSAEFRPLHPLLRKTVVKLLRDPWEQAGVAGDVIFIHIPKTAGTSICDAIGQNALHIPLSRFAAYNPERFAACKKAAFVRNPWSRLSSAFNYLHSAIGLNASADVRWATRHLSEYKDFEQFVLALEREKIRNDILSYIHFRPQFAWLQNPDGDQFDMDFIGRFENLENDVDRLSCLLNKSLTLNHLRKPQRQHQPVAWSDQMVAIVGRIYAQDVAQFDYATQAPER